MTEFIGSRISLISKRDIRYVGTLHEISSENSTVALEQVVSFGTEGRRPDDEVPASDNVYEYIVFRGSDVKDLRIEEGPKENNPPPPQVPDDPAILGSARRPTPAAPQAQPVSHIQPAAPLHQQQQNQAQPQQRPQQPPPHFQNQSPFQYPYPPPNQRFGPQGFPPGPGFPGVPYGAPPGWYPPPGYGFPPGPPGQFHPHQMPIGPPGQPPRQTMPQPPTNTPVTGQPKVKKDSKPSSKPESPVKPTATVKLPSASVTPVPPTTAQTGPPPPTESKPDVAAALAPPLPAVLQNQPAPAKSVPTGPKSGRIIPAVPLPSPNIRAPAMANGTSTAASGNAIEPTTTKPTPTVSKTIEEANRDARAAVAAAMAKLPPAPGQKKPAETGAMDNLTRKVNEMRTNDNVRTSRQPGTGGYAAGHRGGERGAHRGGRRYSEQQGKKVEVPTTDYDFASANAKFNKQDLVKEAIATGSPVGISGDGAIPNGAEEPKVTGSDERKVSEPTMTIPAAVGYNKSSSFFDNISSEIKDRNEEGGNKLGGREFRSEERQKNLETFGQGSVDNGYRGGYGRGGRGRGRGYGRGRGGRGGFEARGARSVVRGGRGAVVSES